MGLIYVNPEGPNGNPDPLASARDIRETFRRMAMNDEETVALIAGGHTFGKTHGAGAAPTTSARSRRRRRSSSRASAGRTRYGSRQGRATRSPAASRSPGRQTPTRWSNYFFENLFGFEWELTESPAGAKQWVAKDAGERHPRPGDRRADAQADDAHLRPRAALRPGLRADLAPLPRAPRASSPTRSPRPGTSCMHRDMGPVTRYLGPWVRRAAAVAGPGAGRSTTSWSTTPTSRALKETLLDVRPVGPPAGAARRGRPRRRFRATDKRGGANGARIRLAPQKDWAVNDPAELAPVLPTLERIQQDFNGAQSGGKRISLADLIVLGGGAAVEKAARDAGHDVTVPFTPGRTDATQEQTDVESFAVLEPEADGFRNYIDPEEKLPRGAQVPRPGEPAQADRAAR